MGWLFTEGQTKAELIQHLAGADSSLHTRRKCVRGNTLWAIQENVGHPALGPFIVAYLMRKQPGYGWGYKPVEESMGPVATSCPLSYLDEVPEPPNTFGREWRQRVRERHERTRHKRQLISRIKPGDNLTLEAGVSPQFLVVESTSPLLGKDASGDIWRVPDRHVRSITRPD